MVDDKRHIPSSSIPAYIHKEITFFKNLSRHPIALMPDFLKVIKSGFYYLWFARLGNAWRNMLVRNMDFARGTLFRKRQKTSSEADQKMEKKLRKYIRQLGANFLETDFFILEVQETIKETFPTFSGFLESDSEEEEEMVSDNKDPFQSMISGFVGVARRLMTEEIHQAAERANAPATARMLEQLLDPDYILRNFLEKVLPPQGFALRWVDRDVAAEVGGLPQEVLSRTIFYFNPDEFQSGTQSWLEPTLNQYVTNVRELLLDTGETDFLEYLEKDSKSEVGEKHKWRVLEGGMPASKTPQLYVFYQYVLHVFATTLNVNKGH